MRQNIVGDVNKLFVFKNLLIMPSNILPLHFKQTFPPIIWIFTEFAVKVMGSNTGYLLRSFLLYLPTQILRPCAIPGHVLCTWYLRKFFFNASSWKLCLERMYGLPLLLIHYCLRDAFQEIKGEVGCFYNWNSYRNFWRIRGKFAGKFPRPFQRIIKVHIFWEGHKILWNLPLTFDCSTYSQK